MHKTKNVVLLSKRQQNHERPILNQSRKKSHPGRFAPVSAVPSTPCHGSFSSGITFLALALAPNLISLLAAPTTLNRPSFSLSAALVKEDEASCNFCPTVSKWPIKSATRSSRIVDGLLVLSLLHLGPGYLDNAECRRKILLTGDEHPFGECLTPQLRCFCQRQLERPFVGYEHDDVIQSLTRQLDVRTVILAGQFGHMLPYAPDMPL